MTLGPDMAAIADGFGAVAVFALSTFAAFYGLRLLRRLLG